MKFNTKAIHGGQIKEKGYGAVMPPIYQTSTYSQTKPGEHLGYEYSRTHNPTRSALERSLASIENGKYGMAFSSGLSAIDAILKLSIIGVVLGVGCFIKSLTKNVNIQSNIPDGIF